MSLIPPGTRKNNCFYIYRYSVGGKQHEISTKTTNFRDARAFARRIDADVRAHKSKHGSQVGRVTFAQASAHYIAARAPGPGDVRFLEKLNEEIGELEVEAVRPADIAAAANAIYPDAANETKNRQAYTPAASVLHFAAENEWCSYRKIKKLPEREPETRRIAADAMKRLLGAATGDMEKLLTFLYLQGWRIGEALSLQREHVSFERKTLRVYVGKARRWKTVPMHEIVGEALEAGDWFGDYAFPWRVRQHVYPPLRRLCVEVGVRFTPHMARHAFGSELREVGATGRDLTDLGTWTNERSTARYQNATEAHKQSLIGKRGVG